MIRDMRQVEFVPFRLSEVADIFSIRIDGKEDSELKEFIISFKDNIGEDLQKDFEQVIKTLAEVAQKGVRESFFRPEGKFKDRVCAIPLYTATKKGRQNGTLRLYCIRISDKLLVVGGGGIKITQTYEENEALSTHVLTLQNIDKELSRLEKEGKDIHKEIYNLVINID